MVARQGNLVTCEVLTKILAKNIIDITVIWKSSMKLSPKEISLKNCKTRKTGRYTVNKYTKPEFIRVTSKVTSFGK